jgi:prophage regulatory protein
MKMQVDRLIRLKEIVGNSKAGIKGLLPISAASYWAGVKSGRYPQPVRLGPKITAWRLSDVLALVHEGAAAMNATSGPQILFTFNPDFKGIPEATYICATDKQQAALESKGALMLAALMERETA